jgi:hypothetical protein
MSSWLSDFVASALFYTPGQTAEKLAEIKPAFTPEAFQQYVAFMTDSGFSDAIRNQTLKLAAVVETAPVLVGRGASGGRYAWVFEVPVVALDRRTATLRIRVGRAVNGIAPHGVLIESWEDTAKSGGKPK